jgi:hypothetical protein
MEVAFLVSSRIGYLIPFDDTTVHFAWRKNRKWESCEQILLGIVNPIRQLLNSNKIVFVFLILDVIGSCFTAKNLHQRYIDKIAHTTVEKW